mgnify:CR=1 FL=1
MDQSELDILIKIRDDLAGLQRARAGISQTKKEAEGFTAVLAQGLGIGTGMELARRGVDMLRETLQATVGDAFRLAQEISNQSEALQMSGEAYQVLKRELAAGGVEVGRLTIALTAQNQSLADARTGAGAAAAAYKALHLNAAEVESLTPEQRLASVTRATLDATDKTRAFQAAGQILGTRGLPQLLNALRNLATNGYGKVAQAAKDAGQVMSDDTAARLEEAQKNIERFKVKATVVAGEDLGFYAKLLSSAVARPYETAQAEALAPFYWMGMIKNDPLGALFGQLPKPPPKPAPPADPAGASTENLLLAQIAGTGQHAGFVQNSPLNTELETRKELLPILKEQLKLYNSLAEEEFGSKAPAVPQAGATEQQVSDYNRWLDLNQKRVEVMHSIQQVQDTPLEQLGRTLRDTTGLITTSLQDQINPAISSLSANIWSAMSGTGRWSDTFRTLGNIAGQVLTDLIVKLLIIKPLLGFFGIPATPGASLGPITPAADAGAAAALAGGGTFVTSGPTHLTVGDNPGGVELVNVIPLSGVGRSTVNGRTARLAGGGSLLAGGALRGAAPAPVVINQTLNIAMGVAATVRAEIAAMAPQLRAMSVDAVQEAAMRGRLRT